MSYIWTKLTAAIVSLTFASVIAFAAPPQIVKDSEAILKLDQIILKQEEQLAIQEEQLTKLRDQLIKQEEQLVIQEMQIQAVRAQLSALKGNKNITSLENLAADKQERKASSSLEDITRFAATGSFGTGSVPGNIQQRISNLKTEFKLGKFQAYATSKRAKERMLSHIVGASLAALVTAEDSYKRANKSVARVDRLLDEIDKTPDLKTSVDLNTRFVAELIQVVNELSRLQSSQSNIFSVISVKEAKEELWSRDFFKF